jgi:hypothetical protein
MKYEGRYDMAIRQLEYKLASFEQKLERLEKMVDQLAAANDQFRLKSPTSTELQAEATRPEWLRLKAAKAYTGFSHSLLYQLMSTNQITSIVIKSDQRNTRGIRLINRHSLDEFIRTHGETKDETESQG